MEPPESLQGQEERIGTRPLAKVALRWHSLPRLYRAFSFIEACIALLLFSGERLKEIRCFLIATIGTVCHE